MVQWFKCRESGLNAEADTQLNSTKPDMKEICKNVKQGCFLSLFFLKSYFSLEVYHF